MFITRLPVYIVDYPTQLICTLNEAKRTQQGNLLLPVGPDMAILNKPDRFVAQRLRPLSRRLRLLLEVVHH